MSRSGLIATKIGNSSYYHEDGTNSHVTVLKVDECIVSNIKTFDKDLGKFIPKQLTIQQTLITLIILTFLNPHVYLDTVILLGMVSLQYKELELLAFGCGACFARIIFFCVLGFGASAMSSFFNNRLAWRFLDLLISATMFFISFKLIFQSGLLN